MGANEEFLHLLEAGDARAVVAAWSRLFPQMPVPASIEAAEITMHHARTQTSKLPLKHRAYSHAWLCERGYPSGLPDPLRPSAERLYPTKKLAVGISVNFSVPFLQPAAVAIRGAMEGAVMEAHEDGKLADTVHVKKRMLEAREREERALFGRDRVGRVGETGDGA